MQYPGPFPNPGGNSHWQNHQLNYHLNKSKGSKDDHEGLDKLTIYYDCNDTLQDNYSHFKEACIQYKNEAPKRYDCSDTLQVNYAEYRETCENAKARAEVFVTVLEVLAVITLSFFIFLVFMALRSKYKK
jgi:hypothetical protein